MSGYIVAVESADPDYSGWQREVTGPFRTRDKAEAVARRFQEHMDIADHLGTWFAHVVLLAPEETVIADIRRYVEQEPS